MEYSVSVIIEAVNRVLQSGPARGFCEPLKVVDEYSENLAPGLKDALLILLRKREYADDFVLLSWACDELEETGKFGQPQYGKSKQEELDGKVTAMQKVMGKRLGVELSRGTTLRIYQHDEEFNRADAEDFDDTFFRDYFVDLLFLDVLGMRVPVNGDSQAIKNEFHSRLRMATSGINDG